jgi:hypothetical protein
MRRLVVSLSVVAAFCQYRRIVYTLYRAHREHFATFLR